MKEETSKRIEALLARVDGDDALLQRLISEAMLPLSEVPADVVAADAFMTALAAHHAAAGTTWAVIPWERVIELLEAEVARREAASMRAVFGDVG